MSREHTSLLRYLVRTAAALLTCAVVLTPGTAAAHDQVIAQFPDFDEHLDEAPEEITLEFTAIPLDLGNIVMVVDAEGNDWALGAPLLDQATVVQPVDGTLPDGHYQVRWRVVSSDGHPISESFLFSVGDTTGAAPIPEPDQGTEQTSGPDNQNRGEFALDGAREEGSPTSQISRTLLFVLAGGLGGGLLFVLGRMALTGRSRSQNEKGDTT